MWRRRLAITFITLGATASAYADPPDDEAARKPRARTAEEAAHEEHPGAVQKHVAIKAMQGALRRANRQQARKQRHGELQGRLHGQELSSPMRAELRNHARRESRLQRIRAVAVTADPALLPRIDQLIARETVRHEQRLTALIARAKAAAPGHGEDHDSNDEVEE